MSKKKTPFLPAPFVKRLVVYLALCTIAYLVRNWYNIHYYNTHVTVYNGYQIFLIYPLFGLFAYFFRDRIRTIQHYPIRFGWTFSFSVIALFACFLPFSILAAMGFGNIIVYFLFLYFTYAALFLAIFGPTFVRVFARELLLFANISVAFILCGYLLDHSWQAFAFVILRALSFILPVFDASAVVNVADLSVTMRGFRIIVGAPCAGLYSLFLFVLFFLLSFYFVKQTKAIRRGRAAFVFFSGFIALFILNIFRIASIVLIGAFYSQEIAISIFHEYGASVIFVIFLFLYLHFVLPWITKEKTSQMLDK